MRIKPIIDIKDLVIKDQRIKPHYKHYDPLAITLKIIAVIIDRMGITEQGPFTGITQQELVELLIPLLERMDRSRSISHLTRSDHCKVLEVILDKLLYLKREGLRFTYTDYLEDPPVEREFPFRLISHYTVGEEHIILIANTETINFFLQMLEINLEDHQQAILHVLDRQINRGEFDSALETAHTNILMTKRYMMKVEEIINRTRRNLASVDWSKEGDITKELQKCKEHIRECNNKQSRQHGRISQQLAVIDSDEHDTISRLNQLKKKLADSLELLLPLQNKLNEAHTTFLDEQCIQILFSKKKEGRLQLEPLVLDRILLMPYQKFLPLLENVIAFFSYCHAPAIFTYGQLLNLCIKGIKLPKPREELKKSKTKLIAKPLKLDQYSESLRQEVITFVKDYFQTHQNKSSLQELLRAAESAGKSFLFCNYLRLLIQGRHTSDNFERHIFDYSLDVKVQFSSLKTRWFWGDDYSITLEE